MSGANNHFNQATKFTLYITAVSPRMDHTAHLISPWAVLEIFVGSRHALNALEWTQWTFLLSSFNSPMLCLLHFLHRWRSGMLIKMMYFFSTFYIPGS